MASATLSNVETLLRQRGDQRADDAVNQALTPIRALIAKGATASITGITGQLDTFEASLRTFLYPIYESEEIASFLQGEAVQTLVLDT